MAHLLFSRAGLAGKKAHGFTMIELMVVVAVIGILTAIALPSYQSYVLKSKRTMAKTALLDLASREEKFYSTNNAYTAVAANLGYTAFPLSLLDDAGSNSPTNRYTVTVAVVANANPPTFTLTATAVGRQSDDTSCLTFTLNSLGQQTSASASNCW